MAEYEVIARLDRIIYLLQEIDMKLGNIADEDEDGSDNDSDDEEGENDGADGNSGRPTAKRKEDH